MELELEIIVQDFARGLEAADARHPRAVNARTKKPFQPGIGPHSESETAELVIDAMRISHPQRYEGRMTTGVPYPDHGLRDGLVSLFVDDGAEERRAPLEFDENNNITWHQPDRSLDRSGLGVAHGKGGAPPTRRKC